MPQVSALIEADWKAAGIDVQPHASGLPEALQIGRDSSFNVAYTTSGSDPDLLRAFFVTGGSFNWSKVSTPAIDAALAEGLAVVDPAVRVARYAEVQHAVMDQALIIPIRDYVNLNGVSTQVTGLRFDRRGWFPWLVDVQWPR
jgi:peptide/nickel transport system substrate-binding protein